MVFDFFKPLLERSVNNILHFDEKKKASRDLEAHFHVMPSFDFSGSPSANDFAFGYKYCIQR